MRSPKTSSEKKRQGVLRQCVRSPKTLVVKRGDRQRLVVRRGDGVFWDIVCVHHRLVVRRGDGVFWDDVCIHQRLVVRRRDRVF